MHFNTDMKLGHKNHNRLVALRIYNNQTALPAFQSV